jgi:hypothetical protein
VLDGEAPQQIPIPPCRSDVRTVTGPEPVPYLDGIRQELVDHFGHPFEHIRTVGWEEVVVLEPELRIEGA